MKNAIKWGDFHQSGNVSQPGATAALSLCKTSGCDVVSSTAKGSKHQ